MDILSDTEDGELAPWDERDDEGPPGELVVRVHAAALYVALLKAGLFDEAAEFAEWYLDTFDHDLET